jgi:hypothetical protein
MHVMQAVHHLMEISPRDFLWEFSCFGNEVKEFSSAYKLQYDGEAIIGSFIFVFVGGVLSYADQPDQIFMLQMLHDAQLMLQSLESGCFLLVFLDRNQIAMFISS